MTRLLAALATVLRGDRCDACGARSRRMVAHWYLDHGDEATT